MFQATSIFEGLDNGEILCAVSPFPKIFITGGTSCVSNHYKTLEAQSYPLLQCLINLWYNLLFWVALHNE